MIAQYSVSPPTRQAFPRLPRQKARAERKSDGQQAQKPRLCSKGFAHLRNGVSEEVLRCTNLEQGKGTARPV